MTREEGSTRRRGDQAEKNSEPDLGGGLSKGTATKRGREQKVRSGINIRKHVRVSRKEYRKGLTKGGKRT